MYKELFDIKISPLYNGDQFQRVNQIELVEASLKNDPDKLFYIMLKFILLESLWMKGSYFIQILAILVLKWLQGSHID